MATKRAVVARNGVSLDDYLAGLVEIQDDWSAATFWYGPIPSAPLPAFAEVSARTANLWDAE